MGDTVINDSRTVDVNDPNPLVNTVTLDCTVDVFGNVLQATDDHSVDLFVPAIDVDKTGDLLSKVGDAERLNSSSIRRDVSIFSKLTPVCR